MDAKAEAKALADQERHAREFVIKHNIPLRQWQLAEEMSADLQKKLFNDFWKLWEEDNVKKV